MTKEEWVKRAEFIVRLAENAGVNPGNPKFIADLMRAAYEQGRDDAR